MNTLAFLIVCILAQALSFDCPGDGIYEKGCKSFIKCKDGVAEKIECGEGEVFNPDLEDCDLMENVDTICGQYVDCRNLADGHYPDYSTKCTTYFTCASGVFHNHSYCPDGLVFNVEEDLCDYPWNVYEPCGTRPRPN